MFNALNRRLSIFVIVIILIAVLIILILLYINRIKNAKREKERATEFERVIGYICKIYDFVININLLTMEGDKYFLVNGKVCHIQENCEIDLHGYISPEDYEEVISYFATETLEGLIDSLGEEYFECRILTEDGVYEWFSYTIQGIPRDNLHPNNIVLFRKNIKEIKQKEEQQNQVLMDALETARQASEAKGVFMSRMSHEIRTPLNAVIGYMTLAKAADNDMVKINGYITKCELAGKHLVSIINDVLDISSIESGRVKITNDDFDLKQVLSGISAMFYNQAVEKGINFTAKINNLTEEWVVGDQMRLNQILMNLLSNAVKFTPTDGCITLNVTQYKLDENMVHVKFEVSDTGIGMSKEFMSRIFIPFEQEDASTALNFGGTGLGLSIAKNLVTMMNGTIEVKSTQNEGTLFEVYITFTRSRENEKKLDTNEDFSKVRALVVDDERNSCDYVKVLLKKCGVKSDVVTRGEDAVKQIKKRIGTDYAYGLCILDWNMPGMDGIACAKLIHDECDCELPIIIATAYDIVGMEVAAKEAGVLKIVSKPLFQSTVFDLLVSTFGKYEPKIHEKRKEIDFTGIHVLLAEDNEMNMEIAVDILQKSGFTITQARDGQEVVDKFVGSEPGTYQVILMDIQLPVRNGYEATKIIRNSNHLQATSIPIIAMTANAFAEDVNEAYAAGMNDHVSKPIDYDKLLNALQKITDNSGDERNE